jgi:hypothetical protein
VSLAELRAKFALFEIPNKLTLDQPQINRSNELCRLHLKDVEIITYDELFRKVEILAELLSPKQRRIELANVWKYPCPDPISREVARIA